jgi:hypothetical protein
MILWVGSVDDDNNDESGKGDIKPLPPPPPLPPTEPARPPVQDPPSEPEPKGPYTVRVEAMKTAGGAIG